MNTDLIVYHSSSKTRVQESQSFEASENCVYWKTCIREILISFEESPFSSLFDECYRGAEAYKFLLEIISGLRSEIIGETEILGQFKILSQKYQHIAPSLWNSLLKDAKYIRANFLKDYGVQSYGGASRKSAAQSHAVHLIGSGHLADSILCHFAGFKKDLNVYCRSKEKAMALKSKYKKVNFHVWTLEQIGSKLDNNDLVLIAAPVETSWMEENINEKKIQILDFRSTREHEIFHASSQCQYTDLDEIFAEIQNGQTEIKKRVIKIKDEILNRSLLWDNKKVFRPFGWEDICVL